MILEIDTRKEGSTGPTVTIEVDAENCFILAEAFKELGEALTAAKRRYDGRERFRALKPSREASQNALRASLKAKMDTLKALPFRKIVSAAAKDLEISWDEAEYRLSEIRREERREALLQRDKVMDGMLAEGKTVKETAAALGLSGGYLRNMLSRRRKKPGERDLPEGKTAGRSGAA